MEVIKTGIPIILKEEAPIILKDGYTDHYISNRVPIKNTDGNIIGVLGISTDITELKIAHRLEDTLKKAEFANKEREKTLALYKQFVEDQEHDIRTPLSNVAAGTEFLLEEIKNMPDINEDFIYLLEGICQSANEILDYQQSLLFNLYEGKDEGRTIFSRFDLPSIVKHAFQVNLVSARFKKIDYICDYDNSIPNYLVGDSKQIFQCLVDLLSNAVRFTHKGHVQLIVKCLKQTVTIRFSIIDTGIGIPKERHDDIFHPFVKAKPSNKGSDRGRGLGLRCVKRYV